MDEFYCLVVFFFFGVNVCTQGFSRILLDIITLLVLGDGGHCYCLGCLFV